MSLHKPETFNCCDDRGWACNTCPYVNFKESGASEEELREVRNGVILFAGKVTNSAVFTQIIVGDAALRGLAKDIEITLYPKPSLVRVGEMNMDGLYVPAVIAREILLRRLG